MDTIAAGFNAIQGGMEAVTGRKGGYQPVAGTDEVLQRVRDHLLGPDEFALLRVEHQSLLIAAVAMLITLTVLIAGSIWSNIGDSSNWHPAYKRTNPTQALSYNKDFTS